VKAGAGLSPVDLMLLGTVLLWALNITVTRYVLVHGFSPLAYAVIRYGAAIGLFAVFTYRRERSFRIARRDWPLVALAALAIFSNQLGFVYGIKLTSASNMALILGTTPIFIGIIAVALGLESLKRSFWLTALLSFAGVALVAAASGGPSAYLLGDLLALATALTWSVFSVSIAPLMRRYSPYRISSVVLALGWLPLAVAGAPQLSNQGFHFNHLTWIGFAYAVVGPLFLTNILWFTAISRVGASRASLFANLQPFFAVLFAFILLSEHLKTLELAGGALIFASVILERRAHRRAEARAASLEEELIAANP
jgi:drug/metabolite transporter (DMT)-like permease